MPSDTLDVQHKMDGDVRALCLCRQMYTKGVQTNMSCQGGHLNKTVQEQTGPRVSNTNVLLEGISLYDDACHHHPLLLISGYVCRKSIGAQEIPLLESNRSIRAYDYGLTLSCAHCAGDFAVGENRDMLYVPLGLKAWFSKKGIRNVEELDWWQELVRSALPGTVTGFLYESLQAPRDPIIFASVLDHSLTALGCS
eukprot:385297-Pelagomonas_calceolata.AAC.1